MLVISVFVAVLKCHTGTDPPGAPGVQMNTVERRDSTPLAVPVAVPSEYSIAAVPLAGDTGIRRQDTLMAAMPMPPIAVDNIPVAESRL